MSSHVHLQDSSTWTDRHRRTNHHHPGHSRTQVLFEITRSCSFRMRIEGSRTRRVASPHSQPSGFCIPDDYSLVILAVLDGVAIGTAMEIVLAHSSFGASGSGYLGLGPIISRILPLLSQPSESGRHTSRSNRCGPVVGVKARLSF